MRKFKKPDSRRPSKHSRGEVPTHGRAPVSNRPKGRAVVGIHAVNELLKVRPRAVADLWLKDGFRNSPELMSIAERCEDARVRPKSMPPGALDKIATTNQGVIAFASEGPDLNFSELKALERATLVALDEVEDPHNLGAVLRTAWLFGAQGLILPEARAASVNATVSKVAQGAVEHVPVLQDSGFLETLKHLKEEGFWLYGLAANGSSSLYKTEIPEKVIWVLGSESSGLRKSVERECDALISIPQVDPNASFNVSVAGAIALAETFRQRA